MLAARKCLFLSTRLYQPISVPSHAQQQVRRLTTIYSHSAPTPSTGIQYQVTHRSWPLSLLSSTQQRSRDRPVIPVKTAGVAPFRRSAIVLSPRLLDTPFRSPVFPTTNGISLDQSLHRSGVADIDCEHDIKFTVCASAPFIIFLTSETPRRCLSRLLSTSPSPWIGLSLSAVTHGLPYKFILLDLQPLNVSRTFPQSDGPHIPPRWALALSRE
jgi:hypothetical protein